MPSPPYTMQLITAKHVGGKKIFQHSLHSKRDISFTLSGCGHFLRGCCFHPISLGRLCLTSYFLSANVRYCYHARWGKRVGDIPPLPEFLWDSLDEEHCLFDPISLSVPLPAPPPQLEEGIQAKGGLDSHPISTQTEGLGYHPSLKLLWEANQARTQLEYELIKETQELAESCKHKQAKQAKRHSRWRAQMIDQTDATLQEVLSQVSLMEAVKLLPWCISTVVPFCYISRAATAAAQQDKGILIISRPCPTVPEPEPHDSPVLGPSGVLTPPPVTFPLPVSSLPDIPLAGTPLLGYPFADLAIPSKGKQDHSPRDSSNCLHAKRTHITSPEVEVGSDHSSTQGNNHMPDLTLETRTSSRQQRQESSSPSSSPTRGLANPDDEAVAGSSKSTEDWTSSDSGSSKGNMADSDLDTASGECLTCSDTDDVSTQTAQKKYRKRVRASCKLSKGSAWMETQIKRIRDSHQDVWGHDHKIVRTEWKCALVEDCTSFEMRRMMTRTDQLLHIAKATGSKVYTRESEVGTCSLAKALVLSLKHFHAHFYRLYKKRTTREMVGLQGLHTSNTFQHLNISASVGLNSFCPWCFKFRGNTKTITTHLSELHYRLAISCNVCWAFARMSMQVVLEHQSRCRTKSHKKFKAKEQDKAS